MSWDPYVDQLITSGLHHCCIAGHTGQIWGTSPNFKITAREIATLSRILNDDVQARDQAFRKGFTLCGMPYALNRLDDPDDDLRYLVARCKKNGKPARGALVGKTAKTVIVAVHDPVYAQGESFEKARVAVSVLAESLSAMNF